MKICYYPGCTLKTKAKDLDAYARKSAAALGVEMEEIEGWQCCGAVYPMAKDEVATKLSAVRALAYAKEHGGKLLTLCSACHNVIKRTNDDMKNDENMRFKANNYLALEQPYQGETEVIHYLEKPQSRRVLRLFIAPSERGACVRQSGKPDHNRGFYIRNRRHAR